MSRQKAGPSGSVLNSLFVLTVVLLGYVGAIGFGAVWLRHQISITANTIKILEQRISEVQRRVDEAAAEVAAAESPENLIRLNTALGLNLVQPREEQVMRVSENVERRLAAKRFDKLFSSAPPGAPTPSH